MVSIGHKTKNISKKLLLYQINATFETVKKEKDESPRPVCFHNGKILIVTCLNNI